MQSVAEGWMMADRHPLVSVVLPTYDRPDLLRRAVTTVLEQTYPTIELVVVDDCSPEPVRPHLEEIETTTPIRCIRHETNHGANVARATGIEHASGTYVAFLDDDDRWHPSKLTKQMDRMRSDEAVGLVYTGQAYLDASGRIVNTRTPTTSGHALKEILEGASVGPFSTLLVNTEAIDAAGLPDPRFPSLQDREWVIRLAAETAIAPVAEPLVYRQMHADGQISENFEAKRDVTYPLMLSIHRPTARSFGTTTERRFIANVAKSVASTAIQTGHHRDAIRFAARSIRHNPFSRYSYLYLGLALAGDVAIGPARWLKHRLFRLHPSR